MENTELPIQNYKHEYRLSTFADISRSTESFNNLTSRCDITADSSSKNNTSFDIKDSMNNRYTVKLNKSFSPIANSNFRQQVGIPKPNHYLSPEW